MHDAYFLVPVIERLPKFIESLACYSNNLLVGTRDGCLLCYSVHKKDSNFSTNLEKSIKNFSRKPINQLEVVSQYHLLISIADGVVSVHDLTVFNPITTLERTRGANCFTVDVQQEVLRDEQVDYHVRLCVSVKKKLQFYYWKNRQFIELRPDLIIHDIPKSIVWCMESVFLGFKKDYYLVSLTEGTSQELFSTGKQLEPSMLKLTNSKVALAKDESAIFIDIYGTALHKSVVTWNSVPLQMIYDHPYILALTNSGLEVRTLDPKFLIQSLELYKPKILALGNSRQKYVASCNNVWLLVNVETSEQIKQLLEKKEFNLALTLVGMGDEDQKEKNKKARNIKKLLAYDLFCQHHFDDALDMFADLNIDPTQVISLVPIIAPEDFHVRFKFPDKPPFLTGMELEKAIVALTRYLIKKRIDFTNEKVSELKFNTMFEEASVVRERALMARIADVSLFKCYAQTNDGLITSLLRIPDSNCLVDEVENILIRSAKYQELIVFYQRKNQHEKALDMLLSFSNNPNSPLQGMDRTVSYLVCLGSNNLNIIFEYTKRFINSHPYEALQVFTEDTEEVRGLPRGVVFSFLDGINKDLSLKYVEHVIEEWKDTTQRFHNHFVVQHFELITPLYNNYVDSIRPGTTVMPEAGNEPGKLGVMRRKLLSFLSRSQHYDAEAVLRFHPKNVLLEEKALLLARLGRHEQVISIYVTSLNNHDAAERHCMKVYEENHTAGRLAFFNLFKYYLNPPPGHAINVEAALKVLEGHTSRLDCEKVLETLPCWLQVHQINSFITKAISTSLSGVKGKRVAMNLLQAQNIMVNRVHLSMKETRCLIDPEDVCRVCNKRIGNSAFARYPSGVVAHCFCCKDASPSPSQDLS